MTISRQAVESSNITEAGYDPEENLLEIVFSSGAAYRYTDVPVEVWDNFLASESKGRFFAQGIRGGFAFAKVDEDEPEVDPESQGPAEDAVYATVDHQGVDKNP